MTLQLFEINSGSKGQKRSIPALVVKRALSAGELGRKWLENLDSLITVLEKQWSIVAGRVLFGGTHAYVAYADGRDGAKYVLKIDMPEDLGGEFRNGIAVLEQADGQGMRNFLLTIWRKGLVYWSVWENRSISLAARLTNSCGSFVPPCRHPGKNPRGIPDYPVALTVLCGFGSLLKIPGKH